MLAQDGYARSGGAFKVDDDVAKYASDFVNAYAAGFGDALKSGKISPEQIERRALMYPESLCRMALLNGQRQARKERGATRWRRVLGESKNGPCDECIADSQITHDIDDPFVEFHPGGQCSQQFLQYTMTDGGMLEMPVPSSGNEVVRRRRIG